MRKKPQFMFYVRVGPWLHSDTHIWAPSFLDPEDIRKLKIGTIWKFAKGTGLL
jgi:hypothetical protein